MMTVRQGELADIPSTLFSMRGRNQPTQDAGEFAARLVLALDHAPLQARVPDARGRKAWLATKFKVSRTTAGAWLNGDYVPSPERARELATLCGVRHEWLYFGEGSMLEAEAATSNSMTDVIPETLSLSVRPESLILSVDTTLTILRRRFSTLPPNALLLELIQLLAELHESGMDEASVLSFAEKRVVKALTSGGTNDVPDITGANRQDPANHR